MADTDGGTKAQTEGGIGLLGKGMALRRLEVLNRIIGAPRETLTVLSASLSTQQQTTSSSSGMGVLFTDKEFRYTLESPVLSRDDRIFYEMNGFLIVPDLVEEEILDACCDRFADLCEGRLPKGNITLMKDLSLMKAGAKGMYLYNKAQDILYDPVFEQYFFHKKLIDVVEAFTGPNVMGVHSMLINKPPDSGVLTSRHPLHQDLYYFPFRPADRVVAAWTALEDVTTENGCLVVIPGSHRGELLPHAYPQWEGGVNKMYHGVRDYNPFHLMPVPMKKGHTIFFHPLLLHGSGANCTQGFRRSISCHYAASDCHYIDVTGTIQEGIAQEIVEVAQKRGFTNATYQKIWELRSRLIRGKQIYL